MNSLKGNHIPLGTTGKRDTPEIEGFLEMQTMLLSKLAGLVQLPSAVDRLSDIFDPFEVVSTC
jgi:hypothetical protein